MQVYRSVRGLPAGRIDRVIFYLSEAPAMVAHNDLASQEIGEVWFNPGEDHPNVVTKAQKLGLKVVVGCSIIAVCMTPDEI